VLVGLAVFYMTLKIPSYAQAKGFYGLTAMACLCVLGGLGFDRLSRWFGRFGVVLWVPLLVWAMNAYASFFVLPTDAQMHENLGEVFAYQGLPERGIEHFRKSLRLNPRQPIATARLADVLIKLKRYAEARDVLKTGLIHSPGDLELMNNLAWLLATCPQDDVRDGREALRLAQRTCQITREQVPSLLDTLAAAQAETGDFPAAIQTLSRAIRLAGSIGREDLAGGLRSRLAMYEAGKPYRQ
jgi:tetratricopeptide (TPR) repeat protein